MIEYKFRIPYDLIVDLVGTIDRVHIDPDKDILIITDYKTSAAFTESAVNKARREYEMSFQLYFYLCCLYSGILPAEYKRYITERRYRLDIRLALYNLTDTHPLKVISRPPVSDDFLHIEIPEIIHSRIGRIKELMEDYIQAGERAPMTGMNVYGLCNNCDFRNACLVAHTSREQEILSRFPRKDYDPLNFR